MGADPSVYTGSRTVLHYPRIPTLKIAIQIQLLWFTSQTFNARALSNENKVVFSHFFPFQSGRTIYLTGDYPWYYCVSYCAVQIFAEDNYYI